MKNGFLKVVLAFLALSGTAHAVETPVSMLADDWLPYTGTGTLENLSEGDPVYGTVSFLRSSTREGTGFGFVQRGYWALPTSASRFVEVAFRSTSKTVFYFRVDGTDGKPYYLTYAGDGFKISGLWGGVQYVYLPNQYTRGTGGDWALLRADLNSDLQVLYPGVGVEAIRWIAARGAMDIAAISYQSDSSFLYPYADEDNDGLNNEAELYYVSNVFRADSDGDGLDDILEVVQEGTEPCFKPLDPNLPGLGDMDQDGVSDRDETYLTNYCDRAYVQGIPAGRWTIYAHATSESVIADPYSSETTLAHSSPDPLALGVMFPSLKNPYPSLAIERDQLMATVRDINMVQAENFIFYVYVRASDGQNYYMAFPRAGVARWEGIYGGTQYLFTPLEAVKGYNFAALPFGGMWMIYLDLSQELAAFRPGVFVKEIAWVTIRGRLTFQIGFPPFVMVPDFPVPTYSGQSYPLDVLDPSYNWNLYYGLPLANVGSLCYPGLNACDSYAYSEVLWDPMLQPLYFSPASGSSLTNVYFPTAVTTEYREVNVKVHVTTQQRPKGIFAETDLYPMVTP